jgi:septal ring factor EnvC (AmiA/AmiB activator)
VLFFVLQERDIKEAAKAKAEARRQQQLATLPETARARIATLGSVLQNLEKSGADAATAQDQEMEEAAEAEEEFEQLEAAEQDGTDESISRLFSGSVFYLSREVCRLSFLFFF